jgi:hypothetical protein
VEAGRSVQQGLGGELAEGVFLGRIEDHSGTIGQAIEDHRTHDEGVGEVRDKRHCTVGLSEQHTMSFNHLIYRSRAKRRARCRMDREREREREDE